MKKQIAKILSIALIMTLSVTSFAFAAVTLPSDVEKSNDKGLQQAVTGLIEAGAITGDTDGLFHPEQTLTRAQVCKMIVTLAEPIALNGTPTQPLKESFSDMAGSSWAAPYISYAADNGIALGYGDGKFKPTGNVTVAELVTFAVRACGYSDADLGGTWPQNYLKKAEEMKLFSEPADMAFVTETKTPAQMPEQMQKQQATKANAAMIIYNAMDKIKKDVAEDQPQGTDKDRLKDIPDTASMVYANASFSSDMTKYAGKDISKDAIVYTYAFKKDYAGDMKFSQKASDYRITTIDKYKLAKTQAWYNLENGKITEIVVPNDAGFTGYIYCVINATSARAVNAAGESVDVIDTFTAMKNIKWLGQKGLDKSAITAVGEGNVYELKAKDGVIINIAKTDAKLGKQFAELSGTSWATVLEKDGDTIKIKKSDLSEAWVILKSNTAIYNLDGSNKYETGRLSQIRKDTQVRLYDISDDKETSADIIVVK
ncbi:MAG: S-layer homology domain-containing protein [Eubacteriales bacterium]|nr:S-layer homology domain-containing protein [Eubacteriales bacterium]MDD4390248.1 S-layer homology domain-containing protein [Eubacteriales bacterium]